MIDKVKIKEYVFSKYSVYLKFASDQHGYVKRVGVHPDELINEAIIGIIDTRLKFESEKQIDDFIFRSIGSVAYFENQQVGKKDSMMAKSEDAEEVYNNSIENNDKIFDYGDSEYAAKSEALWDLFYEFRFPDGVECPSCGAKNMTGHPAGWQCKLCRTAISLKSRTYLHK